MEPSEESDESESELEEWPDEELEDDPELLPEQPLKLNR